MFQEFLVILYPKAFRSAFYSIFAHFIIIYDDPLEKDTLALVRFPVECYVNGQRRPPY